MVWAERFFRRTTDQFDIDNLRQSANAVLADKEGKKLLEGLTYHYSAFEAGVLAFKAGINDLVNEINLGVTIKGECDACSQL